MAKILKKPLKCLKYWKQKIKKYKKINILNMNHILFLRKILEDNNIEWRKKINIEIKPFKKQIDEGGNKNEKQ